LKILFLNTIDLNKKALAVCRCFNYCYRTNQLYKIIKPDVKIVKPINIDRSIVPGSGFPFLKTNLLCMSSVAKYKMKLIIINKI